MNFAQDIDDHIYQINAITENGVDITVPGGTSEPKLTLIDGITTLRQSFIVSASTLVNDWGATEVSDLAQEAIIAPLMALDIEILLLGSGDKLIFPETSLLVPFMQRGIGVEVMDSRAACRTYNLLSVDGRKVAAAIIL